MNTLHPIFEQALRPFMPLTSAVVFDDVVAGIQAQKEQDRLAGREFVNQHMHRRPGESRDDFALRLQMQAENTRTGFGETI